MGVFALSDIGCKQLLIRCCVTLAVPLGIPTAPTARPASSWPTLHKDYQRSGYTDEVIGEPCQRKWFRSFVEEMIGARVEAIVAEGLCFVGTYAGNFYALDVRDGKTVWKYEADGAIGHSPCYHDGRVYFCTDEGFDAGSVVCLGAADGSELWKYRSAAGFWNSPACDGPKVYVGDRGGVFHALDAKTGEKVWTYQTGYMILKPASLSLDGKKIVFGSEDMHVYCLSPEGKLLWKSQKLPGLSLRDAAPTIWAGKVVVRTNPARAFHESLREGGGLVCGIQRQIPLDDNEDKVTRNTVNMYFVNRTDRREKAEYEGVLKYLKEHPHSRTWFTLSLEDGREPWIATVMFTAGLHNPPSPPTFHPKTGELYTIMPTALSVYCSGVSQVGIGIGRLAPETGYLSNLAHAYDNTEPGYFAGMPMIADETSSLGLMGDFLLVTHMGALGGVDLKTRKIRQIAGKRDTYGGLFGPAAAPGYWQGSKELAREGYVQNTINEWHGPDRSVAAIADQRMFWVVGGCVVCIGGPDTPAADTGGAQAPQPLKWRQAPRIDGGNVTGPFGAYDQSIEKKPLDARVVTKYLEPPPAAEPSQDPPAVEIRRRLDAVVTELVDGAPWAPWLVELGISHEELHFWRSSETMQTLAAALPHLSPQVRAKAVAYLDGLFDAGVPLQRPVFGPEGRRREHHQLPPELLVLPSAQPPRYSANISDLYAVWAYAHYADRWAKVDAKADAIRDGFRQSLFGPEPVRFDPDQRDGTAVEILNGQIAGIIAYVRIMQRAGDQAEAELATRLLAEMATERVHYEMAEGRLQARRAHHGKIPRYLRLTPEVAHLLADHAREPMARNLADLNRQLPVWYQAWSERLLGGENYVSPPHLARGIFMAMADAAGAQPGELAKYLDQPWCRADLYYIEKLSAVLRTTDGVGRPGNRLALARG
jgi:hypothetical protein